MNVFSKINSYLYYQYIPKNDSDSVFGLPRVIDLHTLSMESLHSLVNKAIQRNIIEGKLNVVPLSGGLDSRLILSVLSKYVDSSKIEAITLGVPGTYDYEIPKLLAKKLGIRHVLINLNDVTITTEMLLNVSRDMKIWTGVFDAFYNSLLYREYSDDVVFWSGFMGDSITGSHLEWGKDNFEEWGKVKDIFSQHECACKKYALYSPDFVPTSVLKSKPYMVNVSYIEQLDFIHRQSKCIFPILLAPEGYKQIFPFLDVDFATYFLGGQRKERLYQKSYLDLIEKECSLFLEIPLKRYWGMSLKNRSSIFKSIKRKALSAFFKLCGFFRNNITHPMLNYLDYEDVFRHREDYREVILLNLHDLRNRRIIDWVDINNVLRDFFENHKPLSNEIKTLVGLEINLKNEN